MVSALVLVAACLARCLLNEGARHSSERQAITPARHNGGTLVTIVPQQGKGGTIKI